VELFYYIKEKQLKNIFFGLSVLVVTGLLMPLTAWAGKDNQPLVPCAHPMFRTLDFWVGDWMVYHRKSGKLAGFDRVGRILKGCAIQQSWISLDDYFSSPLVPFRMNGKSLTVFNGQKWTQLWVDNQAGSQIISGNFTDGKLVLKSETPVMGYTYQLTWQKQQDGTVNQLARRRKAGEKDWEILFDFIYRRNISNVPVPDEKTGSE